MAEETDKQLEQQQNTPEDQHLETNPATEREQFLASVLEEEDDDDWWKTEDDYSEEERKKMEDMYSGTLREFNENEIIEGTVVSMGDKEIVLNIGFKSEGIVPSNEFRDTPDLKPGDSVEVFVEKVEDQNGQLILSRRRAKSMRSWEKINQSMESDVILMGYVMRRTKGGFVVDIDGIEAFLPGSQIDVKPVRDFDVYVGRTMEFKVVKINHAYENVVVSHKVLIEAKLEEQRKEILQNLEKGQVLEGMVKNMTNFGVFIDLGGVDGLLHITDISWGRINHPQEVLNLDEKVNVVVLDFDDAKKRISLGMKQLTPHPWESLSDEISEGSKVKGRVVTVADYGVFLEIIPGVEGLIHTSEMSWSQHIKNPTEDFKVGDELEAVVLNIDREDKKMSLGLKQLKDDPWTNITTKYPVSSAHKGIVRNMTNYGLFVELEEGVDGLVHISDLSWTKKFNHPSEYVQTGEDLEVVVLDIDEENRRLSLGHKQLTEDVWDTFASIFTVGSKHNGTIKKIDGKGAIVELDYGVDGTVPAKHLKVAEGQEELKADQVAEFVVIEFNKDAKRLVLSHTKSWSEDAPVEKKKPAKKSGGSKASAPSGKAASTTLGEQADVLAQLKKQMEANESDTKDESAE
ncbi:30S ribosomal protein S1 [Pontibacter sp. G13]|uniref:30S ribosomal protein S1 n=1 Tax=Pontibacter sp. G13 TaxID=3074898 RepID=UPI002889347D|nr:30S ribosomal protein S1 [Pontibacter sp. G13]WNJ16939.1 30S ribosomal protein S1 [Pontibacter sp. G13]